MSDVTARSRTVFVLGGGGALGAYQAGALGALLDFGVVPDAVYGASVGALNGAFLAHDPTRRRAAELARWWTSEQARQVLLPAPWQRLRGVAAALAGAEGLLDPRPLRRMIDRHVGAHDIAELAIPLHVTTTCLDCVRAVHHSNGDIADVLVASCALPALFPAVRLLDGHRHADAGVLCGVPVRAALADAGPADRILVLDCALAPVTCCPGCAAGPAVSPDAGECGLGRRTDREPYIAPVEPHRGVVRALLDSFAVARAGANVADVGESLADPRVGVLPHLADAWAAGQLERLPAGPRDCSAVHELLVAGRAATAQWLERVELTAPQFVRGPAGHDLR